MNLGFDFFKLFGLFIRDERLMGSVLVYTSGVCYLCDCVHTSKSKMGVNLVLFSF